MITDKFEFVPKWQVLCIWFLASVGLSKCFIYLIELIGLSEVKMDLFVYVGVFSIVPTYYKNYLLVRLKRSSAELVKKEE